MHFDNS
jgi:hypothetical protein